jgi:uncharacterized protein YbgA (DUF1722 family)
MCDLLQNLGMILNSYAVLFELFLIAILVCWQLQMLEEETKHYSKIFTYVSEIKIMVIAEKDVEYRCID